METGWSDKLAERLLLPRQALHAAKLTINWLGGEISWEAQLAVDMKDFIAGRKVEPMPGVVIWSRKG
jgi:23S rRNA pseudouridine1911/1915/1917 synthase